MRLEVLSELPEEWEENVQEWIKIIRKSTPANIPTPNDLYFILQTLVGVMPINGEVDKTLIERVQEYLIKAFREAKANTNWSTPNEDYENAVKELVEHLLLHDKEFMSAFIPFFRKLAHYGWIYSLCQTMLKVTCPGVPDIYQGCELWDFSLVDPDNRRPVDYELRAEYLSAIKKKEKQNPLGLHKQLTENPTDGQVKLYLLYKVLNLRLQLKELFDNGNYIPLTVTGKFKDNIVAFARRQKDNWYLVAVPRLLAQVINQSDLPIGQIWQDTAISLPADAPVQWQNIFSKKQINGQDSLAVADILESFPVGLLTSLKA
jgi:(1->4)-alpha-D-glucan 1-alpha-D-glucosylmutase